jgi:hypothetical protein
MHVGLFYQMQVPKPSTADSESRRSHCIKFLETYEALGIEEVFLLCAIGPTAHQEVRNTIRLFGECVIPHFREKQRHTAPASQLVNRNVGVS